MCCVQLLSRRTRTCGVHSNSFSRRGNRVDPRASEAHRQTLHAPKTERGSVFSAYWRDVQGAMVAEPPSPMQANYGTTGRTRAEGCAASCRMVLVALAHLAEVAAGSPVFRLRSKRGKLLLEISRRRRCPARKTLLVAQRSIVSE